MPITRSASKGSQPGLSSVAFTRGLLSMTSLASWLKVLSAVIITRDDVVDLGSLALTAYILDRTVGILFQEPFSELGPPRR